MQGKTFKNQFRSFLASIFIFIFSLLFCYFASVKNLIYALIFLFSVFVVFEKAVKDGFFLLKVVSPFFVVPLSFYNKPLGILALILAVLIFSALYILRHMKKINVKKLRRIFFFSVFLLYFLILIKL